MILTLQAIADLVHGELAGDGALEIRGANGIGEAREGDLAALEDPRRKGLVADCQATALLATPALAQGLEHPHVVVEQPQIALNRVIEALGLLPDLLEPGIHPTAVVDPTAELGEGVRIGPYVTIGPRVRVGEGCQLHPHAVLEADAFLGPRCRLMPHTMVGRGCRLGAEVRLGAGSVIGAIGFGFGFGPQGAERLHHLGIVVLEDRVEVGAGCTIDRARFGVTRIGANTKIDNQCHVAHNCEIGSHTLVAAQVGIAGSTSIGSQCLVGGKVGIGGHLFVTDRCHIGANSGVATSLDQPGDYYGYWAKRRQTSIREIAAVARLPEALRTLKHLRQQVEDLERRLEEANGSPPPSEP